MKSHNGVLVLLCLCIVVPATLQSEAASGSTPATWEFDVKLDGKSVGYHTYTVREDGDEIAVSSDAAFDVKFLFVTAFKYRHTATETWNSDCLTSIEARTSSNGKKLNVDGQRENNRLKILSTDESGKNEANAKNPASFAQCVKTFAYWNPAILDTETLLNPQTGDYVEIEVTPLGRDIVKVNSQNIEARKFVLRSKKGAAGKPVDLKLWYSADRMRWLALESRVKGNRTIRYEPKTLPAEEHLYSAALVYPGPVTLEKR